MVRTIIFSDVHLTHEFDQKKFDFLKKIVSSADQVIINGDFWEGKLINYNDFLKVWSLLFPLLKQKHAVYIYGNHDPHKYSDTRVFMFSDIQTDLYELKSGNKTFFISHGNPLSFDFALKKLKLPHFFYYIFEFIETLMVKISPKTLYFVHGRFNQELKERSRTKAKNNEYYIYGHTHYQEYDEKNHFINNGFIKHGIGQYLVIEDGKVELKKEKY